MISVVRNDRFFEKSTNSQAISAVLHFSVKHFFSDNLVCKDNWNATEKETDYQAESPFLCPPGTV